MLFQLILGIVLVIKISLNFGQVLFAPADARVRPLALNDSVAKSLYHALVISVAVILSGKLFITFIKDLGAHEQTVSWAIIVLGTILIAVLSYLVIYLKTPISESLQLGVVKNGNNWIKQQLPTISTINNVRLNVRFWSLLRQTSLRLPRLCTGLTRSFSSTTLTGF